jgi:hypothetical protein
MFRASLCPSSGAYQLQQQPLIYPRNVVVTMLLAVVGAGGPAARPAGPPPATRTATPTFLGKPEAAAAVDRLLMMGIRRPETC